MFDTASDRQNFVLSALPNIFSESIKVNFRFSVHARRTFTSGLPGLVFSPFELVRAFYRFRIWERFL
jgi:hypothetical protein